MIDQPPKTGRGGPRSWPGVATITSGSNFHRGWGLRWKTRPIVAADGRQNEHQRPEKSGDGAGEEKTSAARRPFSHDFKAFSHAIASRKGRSRPETVPSKRLLGSKSGTPRCAFRAQSREWSAMTNEWVISSQTTPLPPTMIAPSSPLAQPSRPSLASVHSFESIREFPAAAPLLLGTPLEATFHTATTRSSPCSAAC